MLLNKLNQEVEQKIDPPEYAGWSQRDIDAGIAKLVEQIEDGADWDENDEYSQDLFEQILAIHFSKSIAFDDKSFDIRTAIDNSVLEWASFEVTCNPDQYCEKIVPNDDL